MFKDAKEELERLNRELLEEEEFDDEEYEEDDEEYEEDDGDEESQYDAYNTDIADVDLEEYSEQVRQQSPGRKRVIAAVLLATATVLLFLAYLLAKKGGLL